MPMLWIAAPDRIWYTVIAQTPAAGTVSRQGHTVTLTIAIPAPSTSGGSGGNVTGTTDCQGYVPCLPPGPDVDCAGGSGDGPRYVSGPVRVTGSDPYRLDGDGDGWGCE